MGTFWKPLAIIAGLLLLLTYLLFESRSPDPIARARMQEALAAFELHDAELDRAVLLARAGLLHHYDSLARLRRDLLQAVATLRRSIRSAMAEAAQRLEPPLDALDTALGEKMTIVEHFKSDNALLRNSLMYVVHGGQTLRVQAAEVGAEPVVAELGALANALLQFIQIPDATLGQDLAAVLTRLPDHPALQADIDLLAKHGRLIVEVLPRVDSELRRITTAPTTARVRALQTALLAHYGQAETRAQVFRVLLYAVAVLLLGYLFFLLVRLQRRARDLRRVNAELRREMAEHQRAEQALRASEERLRAITEAAREGIIAVDRAGAIISWNAGAATMFGYAASEALGLPFTRLLAAGDREIPAFAAWSATGRSPLGGATVELTGRRQDGGEFPLEISLSSWRTARDAYLTGIVRDLTERKRLEEKARQQELQLIQANKMTALGILVSGVAHEINNPNQLVLMNAPLLVDAWNDALDILDECQEHREFLLAGLPYAEMRETLPALVRDMRDGALRIQRIIDDLKDFARPRTRAATLVFPLNDAVRRALRLLHHPINQRTARFRVDLAADLPAVRGDPQQIEQIIINLVINALEALPDPQRGVTVSTHDRPQERQVALEIQDEGVGIPPEHLARLCDPFFTTKGESGGTGLGLAIAFELARAHGGHLTFESAPGQGTRARLALPGVTDTDRAPL